MLRSLIASLALLFATTVINAQTTATKTKSQTVTVAYAFSKRCLRDSCGDGSWGASISTFDKTAISDALNGCETHTTRQGSCETGGRYFFQCSGKEKWAALAIYDDRSESSGDGEAMGFDTEAAARTRAVANCNQSGCHAVWAGMLCHSASSTNLPAQWLNKPQTFKLTDNTTVVFLYSAVTNGVMAQVNGRSAELSFDQIASIRQPKQNPDGTWSVTVILKDDTRFSINLDNEGDANAAYQYLSAHAH